MRIPGLSNRNRSKAYLSAKTELFDIFRKDIEQCELTDNAIVNKFLVHKTIIHTHKRLQGENTLARHPALSRQDYEKILNKTVKEVKRKYVNNYPM